MTIGRCDRWAVGPPCLDLPEPFGRASASRSSEGRFCPVTVAGARDWLSARIFDKMVGADEFARDAPKRLQKLAFAPCQITGFVRLPGQAVKVAGRRVYELEQLGVLDSSHGIDEAVIAIYPAQFTLLPTLIKALEHLCLPVRAVVDLGEGVVARERLFQLGNIQMLDLTSTPADSPVYALLKRAFLHLFLRSLWRRPRPGVGPDRAHHQADFTRANFLHAGTVGAEWRAFSAAKGHHCRRLTLLNLRVSSKRSNTISSGKDRSPNFGINGRIAYPGPCRH